VKTLQQRKAGTTCRRCGEWRWPFKGWVEPYTCQRCRDAVAGGQAIDPLGSAAQQAARAVSGTRFRQVRASGEPPPGRARGAQPGSDASRPATGSSGGHARATKTITSRPGIEDAGNR
jgi:hypothetical protein